MSIGKFNYEVRYDLYKGSYIYWTVSINGSSIEGSAKTIRQAYRQARRAVRRYRKMWNLLNPNEPSI